LLLEHLFLVICIRVIELILPIFTGGLSVVKMVVKLVVKWEDTHRPPRRIGSNLVVKKEGIKLNEVFRK